SVTKLKIGSEYISGQKLRSILNLNSANFTIKFNSKDIVVTCKGYGHGVGMSQWGANAMAKEGDNYETILEHYYQGVKITKLKEK
ncbi:MAG: SpoIID/LytB domain-containing protein, partial [Clostridium sp.]|nr:SpoIID/LytB domain-containing protein [Clostridium sp.]